MQSSTAIHTALESHATANPEESPDVLIPRFTIRGLLLLMTVSSFFFLILTFAVRGRVWAIAVSVGVASLLLAFLGYAVRVRCGVCCRRDREPAARRRRRPRDAVRHRRTAASDHSPGRAGGRLTMRDGGRIVDRYQSQLENDSRPLFAAAGCPAGGDPQPFGGVFRRRFPPAVRDPRNRRTGCNWSSILAGSTPTVTGPCGSKPSTGLPDRPWPIAAFAWCSSRGPGSGGEARPASPGTSRSRKARHAAKRRSPFPSPMPGARWRCGSTKTDNCWRICRAFHGHGDWHAGLQRSQRSTSGDLDRRCGRADPGRPRATRSAADLQPHVRRQCQFAAPTAGRAVSGDAAAGAGSEPLRASATSVRSEAVDDVGTLLVLQDMPRVELLPPSELPTRWIDFTCFDLALHHPRGSAGLGRQAARRVAGPPRLDRQRPDALRLRHGVVAGTTRRTGSDPGADAIPPTRPRRRTPPPASALGEPRIQDGPWGDREL